MVLSPTVKLGGYARVWFADGGHLDLSYVAPESSEEHERAWREVGARVEWLLSPKGRLDRTLPQTLPRIVHNANARAFSGRQRA